MQQRIYLFNPDNDLALAHGGGHYIAPPFAQKMQSDLCTLPMWYAMAGSMVLAENRRMCEWIDSTSARWGLSIKGITHDQLANIDASIHPWGWSGTIKKRLVKAGVKAHLLPSDSALAHVRNLAHRTNSIAMHKFIQDHTTLPLSPSPIECRSFEEVSAFAITHPGCYIKMPWSGSGQGVYHAIEPETIEFERWCKGALKRQGSLLCEVGLNRILDFALEFNCSNGNAEFVGYSVFESDFHSQYNAGIVGSKQNLLSIIENKFPSISEIISVVSQAINSIYASQYEGYLGVDMLLYDDGGEIKLDPCVEVNLRATMGLVTCMVGEHILPEGTTGKFKIEYSKSGFPELKENRLYLTPIFDDTQYCAYVELD